ncbi:MAG: dihydroorotase [Chloroflexota bacterium]|nr:dihydroorotase [Chloroflexota bacterium]
MSARDWWLRGGRVVDPGNGVDAETDIVICDGKVVHVGGVEGTPDAAPFDARGMVVSPGWIDVHVHLREPGYEAKETIATGTAAAAAGGFTTICCMPNTRPALDTVAVLDDLHRRVARDAAVRVHPIAAITLGRAGKTEVDFSALAAAGAIGFSDDGDTTANSQIMRDALRASRELERPVMVHCEDKALAHGAMHEGEVSGRLGIEGIPAAAEEIIIARDLMLAELTGGWLHVCHVSTGRGVELIRAAKARGVRVTSEVMPHHLVMDDEWVAGARTLRNVAEPCGKQGAAADPNTKVNPPLRPAADTAALVAALKAGEFDVLATDHAPHAASEKVESDYAGAAFGMSGLEFALPLTLALVRAGHMSLPDLIRRWTIEPAHLLRTGMGTLSVGSVADVTVFDPDERWTVRADGVRTKSANTPLLGMTLGGRANLTLVDGEERHRG